MIEATKAFDNLDRDALQAVNGLLRSFVGQSLISGSIISIINGETNEATNDLTFIRDGAHAWSQWLVTALSFSCPANIHSHVPGAASRSLWEIYARESY